MNTIDSSHKHPPEPDWQLLGELKLPVGVSADGIVHGHLTELLDPLNLSVDFLKRVLISAQNSVMRALHSNVAAELGHIHLSIFVPHTHAIKGKTWGYFHIERIEDGSDGNIGHAHAIDFYLYMDGE